MLVARTDAIPPARLAFLGRGWGLAALYPLIVLLLALFVAYPLVDLLGRALQTDGRLSFAPLAKLLTDPYSRGVVWNTLTLGLTVAVAGTVLATLYAYAMTRVAMPYKGLWHFLALLPTISPPILMALSLILLYGRRGLITNGILGLQTTALYGFWGLVAAQVLSYFPFAYLLMLNLFRGLDASLEEAASTMGAHAGKVLTTVSLPLLVPGLAASVLLLFGYSLADLGNPLLLGGDYPVLSAQIYLAIIGLYDIPQGAALAVLLLAPAVLLFFAHKRLVQSTSFASVGGKGSVRHPQNGHPAVHGAALLLCIAVSLVIILQYAIVLAGATTQLFGINYTFTTTHFVSALTASRETLQDTVGLGIAASLVVAAVGLLTAYFVARSRMPGRAALDFVANLPLAIPGTVIGLAFALAFNHRPLLLTGTALIIIVALTVRSLPYAIRSAVTALDQLHRSLDEASTNMGATAGQTLWRVLLPLVRPAIISGMIFTFTRSVTTLSAVIFVVSPHWSLVTPAILSQMDRGDVGEAAALSVLLVLLVLLVIHGVPRLMGRDWRENAAEAARIAA
jgi:iron(III) transport system permease protein